VVATARSVKPLSAADVLVVRGDIADRKTAERTMSEGMVPEQWVAFGGGVGPKAE